MPQPSPASVFEGMTGTFPSAIVLFGLAKRAHERCGGAGRPIDASEAALTAVLFAALAAEAFLNELADLAEQFGRAGIGDPPAVKAFAAAIGEAEKSRASPRLKLQVAAFFLAGAPLDRGAQPYQDFDLLLTIRDFVVHHKPVHFTWRDGVAHTDHAGLFRELRARNLVEERDPQMAASLLGDVSRPAVAAWAIGAGARVVQELVARIPGGALSEFAKATYKDISA
jgi:hypothetical protein